MDFYQDGGNAAGNGQETRTSAGIPGRDDDRKLFVGGLSRQTADRELKEHFSKFGEIESITVKIDPYTGQSRGFAFIVFTNPNTIDKLLASGDHFIDNRKVDPKRVSKKAQQGKVFVGGLTPEISDSDIKDYFSQFGTIVEVQTPFDKIKNQRKGFCFVTFDSRDVVYQLLKNPKQNICGKEVDVKKVNINPETMGPGGMRGGGRGGGFPGSRGGYGGGGGGGYGGFGGGNDYSQGYGGAGYGGGAGYEGYDYGGGYDGYMDYGSYGGGGAPAYGAGAKPRGISRQFRHQPY